MWLFRKRIERSDEELAKGYFNTGDKSLVGDLFEKHVKTVYGVCLFYFRDKQLARDGVMQVFEKLLTELRKREVVNFSGWLSFVVRNHCISELRKQRRFLPESYLDFETSASDYEEECRADSVTEELLLEKMQECLPLLKETQRACIERFYLASRSYQEIGDELFMSLNAVKSAIQNGKRMLRLMIEEKIRNNEKAA